MNLTTWPANKMGRSARGLWFAMVAAMPLVASAKLAPTGAPAAAVPAAAAAAAAAAATAAKTNQAAVLPAEAQSVVADAQAAKKTVAGLIGAIRYDRRPLAKKYLGFATMARALLGESANQMSPAEQARFSGDFEALLIATSFAKGHALFAYLDGVLYGQAKRDGDRVRLPTTIVVHRNLKKTEIVVDFLLAREADGLKVVDIVADGESTVAQIRQEEVAPLLQAGGTAKLLASLREQVTRAKGPRPP